MKVGDPVRVPPGRSSEGLPERRGLIETIDDRMGGCLVRHFNGSKLGWGWSEIEPGAWPWWTGLWLRAKLWWRMRKLSP